MSQILNEVLQTNQAYAGSFSDKCNLPMPPGRHFAILTCMDTRIGFKALYRNVLVK